MTLPWPAEGPYEVVLRRGNGRYVKSVSASSKYNAKKVAKKWDGIYDPTYDIEIVERPEWNERKRASEC